MAFEENTKDQLSALAEEHGVEVNARATKSEIIEALRAADVPENVGQVSGFQEGVAYPPIPQTEEDFAQLLINAYKPAQFQSAPPQEQLNPHLFGPQGRLS
jgi:hypothetical protein